MGPLIGIILLIVILVVGGVGTFLALPTGTSTHKGGPTSIQSCSGFQCTPPPKVSYHDASVTSPFSTSQAGASVTFSASIAHGTPASFKWFFGDGTTATTTYSSTPHVFASAGSYDVFVQVTDTSGIVHDNLYSLLPFTTTSSYSGDPLGDHVQTTGAIVSNSTSTSSPTGTIPAGGAVTLMAYVSSPAVNSNTQLTASDISFVLQGSASTAFKVSGQTGTGLNASAALQATFTAQAGAPAGSYAITFQAVSSLVTSGVTLNAWSNYTFTLFLGSSTLGNPHVVVTKFPTSPHPGTIQSYEYYIGGAVSLDPSVDYETVGAEVIYNVYETLITYNGSQAGPSPNGFVPEAAACVPGTTSGPYGCQTLFGSTLVTNGGSDYTFVISDHAKFYNPSNGAIMNVYPSDVEWSLVRTCLFVEYPGVANNPGWIECQALLPYNLANPAYDNGLHTPWNNTPANLLNAMTINSSADCPTAAMSAPYSGCITFHTGLSGAMWPEFLELMSDPNGAAIQSCKWDQTQGYTLAGWSTCGSPPSPTSVADNAWDGAISQGSPTSWNQKLAQNMVGSGPYYLAAYSYGQSYALKQSPAWSGTTCVGGKPNGCLPTASQIQATYISNTWETSDTPGLQAYAAGTADYANFPSTDTPTMLNLIAQGKIGALTNPTLSIFFTSFNLQYNIAAAQALTTQKLTAPAYMMQDVNMREFLVHTFPYQTQLNEFGTIDGIQYQETYGGTIPKGMGNFYPTNVTWPGGDPDQSASDVGGAAWWWNQVSTDTLDGSACTTASPCIYPLVLQTGDPADLAMYEAWAQWTSKISGGAVQAVIIQVNFNTLVADLYGAPGSGGFGQFFLGWLPDYPDPSDYTVPMMYPDSTYTLTTAWNEALTGSMAYQNYMTPCTGTNAWNYVVTNACQGWAYKQMVSLAQAGDTCVAPTCTIAQRIQYYNAAEHIQSQLAMYTYDFQQVGVGTYASWINPASFTPNPVTPGNVWWFWSYQGQPIVG